MKKPDWINRSRGRWQALALFLMVFSPFGLYSALQKGDVPLTIIFFCILTLSMLLTYLSG
jgi:hypothetical protein